MLGIITRGLIISVTFPILTSAICTEVWERSDREKTWPESDLEMMEKTIPEFINKEPFHIYYLTVSGHSAYTRIGNMMASRHYHVFKHLDLPEEAICYMAANYDLELALEYLLQQLRDAASPTGLSSSSIPTIIRMRWIRPITMPWRGKLDETFGVYESAAFFYHDGIEPK